MRIAAPHRPSLPRMRHPAALLALALATSISSTAFAACPADQNGDGTLNIFDFLAFQSHFSNGNLAKADLTGDGQLNVFDFLEFQRLFGLGCPPDAPSDLVAGNVWGRTVDLNWRDNSGDENEFRIAISRDGVNWDHSRTTQANDTSVRVDGLEPCTAYWFKVRAANDAGFSDYSNIIQVTTNCETPGAPQELRTSDVWAHAADLRWNDVSTCESGVNIALSTDGVNFNHVDGVGQNETHYRLSGLHACRTYWAKVRYASSCGYSPYSSTITFTTGCDLPEAPGGLHAANVWSRTVDVCWLDNTFCEDEYRIAISTDGVNFDHAASVGRDATCGRIDGLRPSTQYWIKVRASSACGYSNYSNTILVTTACEAPAAPGGLGAANVWSRTIDACWTDLSDNEQRFIIALSTDGANFNDVGESAANDACYRITGLQPSTNYWIRVRAQNSCGHSGYSNTILVTTPCEAPAAPSDLRTPNIWARAFDLCWTDNSSNETEFLIALSTDGVNFNNKGETLPNDTCFRVTDLQPDTVYWVKVRAANDCGFSDYAGPIQVRTRRN